MKRFAEYDKLLGPPEGPGVKNGYSYSRSFRHARVWLDLEKMEGRIDMERREVRNDLTF